MPESHREMLVRHAVARGYEGQALETLLLEAEDNYRLLGFPIMLQQFIIKLTSR